MKKLLLSLIFSFSLFLNATPPISCPTSYVLDCGELIKNGEFSYRSESAPVTVYMEKVCEWSSLMGTADGFVQLDVAHFGSDVVNSTGKHYSEGIKTAINFSSTKAYMLTFDVRPKVNYAGNYPLGVAATLINESDISGDPNYPNIAHDAFMTLTSGKRQDIQVLTNNDLIFGWKTFSVLIEPNANYDHLGIYIEIPPFPTPDRTTAIYVDNVSLVELKADAGPDKTIATACVTDVIGPECPIPDATYSWSPTSGLSDPNIPNPTLIPTGANSITYTLTVSHPSTTYQDQETVEVTYLTNSSTLFDGKDVFWGFININEIVQNPNGGYKSTDASFVLEGDFTVDADWILTNCKLYMKEDAKLMVTNGATFTFDGDANSIIQDCDGSRWDGIYSSGNARVDINNAHPFKNSNNGITITDGADLVAEDIDFLNNKRCIYSSTTASPRNQLFSVKDCNFNSGIIREGSILNGTYSMSRPQTAIWLKDLISTHANRPEIRGNNFYGEAGRLLVEQGDVEIVSNKFSGFYNPPGTYNQYNPAKEFIAIDLFGATSLAEAMPDFKIEKNLFYNTQWAIKADDQMVLTGKLNGMNVDLSSQFEVVAIYGGVPDNKFFVGKNNYVAGRKGRFHLHDDRIYNVSYGYELYNNDLASPSKIAPHKLYCTENNGGVGIIIDNSNLSTNGGQILLDGYGEIKYANKGITLLNAKALIVLNITDISEYTPPTNDCTDPNVYCPCLNPPCQFPTVSGYAVKSTASTYYIAGNPAVFSNTTFNTQNTNNEALISEYSNASFYCFKIDRFEKGIRFEGLNSFDLSGSAKASEFKDNSVDILLNNYAEIGTRGNYLVGCGWQWKNTPAVSGFDISCRNNTDGSKSTLIFGTSSWNTPVTTYADPSSSMIGMNFTASSSPSCQYLRKKGGSSTQDSSASASAIWLNKQKRRKDSVPANRSRYEQQLAYWKYQGDSTLSSDSLIKLYGDSLTKLPFGKLMAEQKSRKKENSIKGVTAFHQFDKDARFAARMNAVLRGGKDINKGNLDKLRTLASECPYEKGVAVHQARNVLGQMGKNYFLNDCEYADMDTSFSSGKKRLKSQSVSSNMVSIYPNPSSNSLTIEFINFNEIATTIFFYDLLGKEVYQTKLNEGKFHFISTEQFDNGIYFYRIIQKGVEIQKGKQIIQH